MHISDIYLISISSKMVIVVHWSSLHVMNNVCYWMLLQKLRYLYSISKPKTSTVAVIWIFMHMQTLKKFTYVLFLFAYLATSIVKFRSSLFDSIKGFRNYFWVCAAPKDSFINNSKDNTITEIAFTYHYTGLKAEKLLRLNIVTLCQFQAGIISQLDLWMHRKSIEVPSK